tara:strand:- start:3175 stop:3504 length:330 start_codon:yes stop_codon:yes gene_type:complete
MRYSIQRQPGHYFEIEEILFIKDELLSICGDNATKAYVAESIHLAEKGVMGRSRINRILGHKLNGPCRKKFDAYPGDAMMEIYNRKQYYMKNYGENEYENKIRNTLDWR